MRIVLLLLAVASLAGCAFESAVGIRFDGGRVTESLTLEQPSPQTVSGVATKSRRIARIECSFTVYYDVHEATGHAVLAQTYALRLRTAPLRAGTPYTLDCRGPVVVELPADASDLAAAAVDASGTATSLDVQSVQSVAAAFGKRLHAAPARQLALVRAPELSPGDYRLDVSFRLPQKRAFTQKVLPTASVTCGTREYVVPVLPPVSTLRRAPAFRVDASTGDATFTLPRVAPGIASLALARKEVRCAPR